MSCPHGPVDPTGEPVFGADVRIGRETVRTDGQGRFVVHGYCGEVVDVEVSRDGFFEGMLRNWPVRGAPPLRIVLERARRVVVAVESPAGRALPGASPRARDDGTQQIWRAYDMERGAWMFEELPARPLVIEVALGGRIIEEGLDALSESLTFIVPEWSEVHADPRGLLDPRTTPSPPSPELRAEIQRSIASAGFTPRAGKRLFGVMLKSVANGTVVSEHVVRGDEEAIEIRLFSGHYEVQLWAGTWPFDGAVQDGVRRADLACRGIRLHLGEGERVLVGVDGDSLVLTRP